MQADFIFLRIISLQKVFTINKTCFWPVADAAGFFLEIFLYFGKKIRPRLRCGLVVMMVLVVMMAVVLEIVRAVLVMSMGMSYSE